MTVLHPSAVGPSLPLSPSTLCCSCPTPAPTFRGSHSDFLSAFATFGPRAPSSLMRSLVFLLLFPCSFCSFSQLRMKRFSQFQCCSWGKLSVSLRDFKVLPEDMLCTHTELPWYLHKLRSFFHATRLCFSVPRMSITKLFSTGHSSSTSQTPCSKSQVDSDRPGTNHSQVRKQAQVLGPALNEPSLNFNGAQQHLAFG